MKKVLGLVLALMCLLPMTAKADVAPRGWDAEEGYQYVLLGEYPYEEDGTLQPVLWRILAIEDGRMLLMSEHIIDTMQVVFITDKKVAEKKSYPKINSYEESDMYAYLNGEGLDILLGDDPIRETLIEQPGVGLLFLLEEESLRNPDYGFPEIWNYGNMDGRRASGTPYAVSKGLRQVTAQKTSAYWVPYVRPSLYWMQIVGEEDGHLSWAEYTRTTWPGGPAKGIGVRPCLRLDMSRVTVTGGNGTQESPFTLAYAGSALVVDDADEEPIAGLKAEEASADAQEPDAESQPEATIAPVPEATVEPTAAPTEEPVTNSITISFVGDCSIGDSVQYRSYGSSYHTTLATNGYDWPFSLVKQYLEADDLTVANLEVVFTTRKKHTEKVYNLVGDPAHVQVLIEGSIEVVNTVNNHALDFMTDGYQDTLDTLDAAGIHHFGSINVNRADGGFDDLGVLDVGELRIGFVGFTYPQIQQSEEARIIPRIRQLKEEEGCDLVVVSVHWGKETSMKPVSSQYQSAKLLIDGGADIIWGHHPHVIQPIEFYKGKPIFYSTGNFTFGTMSKVDPSTGIFQLTYEKVDGEPVLTQLRVIPCETQGAPDYRPFELTEQADRQSVFKKLMSQRNVADFENLPESFLETGIVEFENGQMLP